jgi:hypothetical protein
MGDVGDVAREQVVDADHRVAAIEQGFGKMGANEPGRAGDDHSLCHAVLLAVVSRRCGR